MLRHAMVSDKPGGLSVQPPTPPGKLNWQHSKNHLLVILDRAIDLDAIFIALLLNITRFNFFVYKYY